MNINIKKVIDFGTHSSKKVEFIVHFNCNTDHYLISDTTHLSNLIKSQTN